MKTKFLLFWPLKANTCILCVILSLTVNISMTVTAIHIFSSAKTQNYNNSLVERISRWWLSPKTFSHNENSMANVSMFILFLFCSQYFFFFFFIYRFFGFVASVSMTKARGERRSGRKSVPQINSRKS